MLRRTSLLLCAALAACSSGDGDVTVAVSSTTHDGEWVGTIAGRSVLTWNLTEAPQVGSGPDAAWSIVGAGRIRAHQCVVDVDIVGTRVGAETTLELTTPFTPSASILIVGDLTTDGFEGVFSLSSGQPIVACIGEVGGLVRVGKQNDAGLNGQFNGFWFPTSTFADTAAQYAVVHLAQSGTDVFGTVDWIETYPCSAGGFLSGVFDGQEFLANVISSDTSDAFFLLEGTWDPEGLSVTGLSTLLGPGPTPECALMFEEQFSLYDIEGSGFFPLQAEEATYEPLGVVRSATEDGDVRVEGVLLRREDPTTR